MGLTLRPTNIKELGEALAASAAAKKKIRLGGNFSKRAMAGPVREADVTISPAAMTRVLQYEPADLTLSVEAGAPWLEVCRVLSAHRQMIPLDPPFSDAATVGGVIATNAAGPRRRLYGSARDLVIGMRFVTLEGKEVQSGGMVVKNVAGLDMGKLMIGSFGTLAAIAFVNFKLTPKPEVEKTSLLQFDTLATALERRDELIRGVLQPAAIDLVNPQAAAGMGERGYILAVQYGGNAAVVERYRREVGGTVLEGARQESFWNHVVRFSQRFVEKFDSGVAVRASSTLTGLREVLESADVPALARAANGISYLHFTRQESAVKWIAAAAAKPWRLVVEFAPEKARETMDLWPRPGDDFGMMKRIKRMFDPDDLLNHGRLYRLI